MGYERVVEECCEGPGKVLEFFVSKRVRTLKVDFLNRALDSMCLGVSGCAHGSSGMKRPLT